jgi:hypothetical protein
MTPTQRSLKYLRDQGYTPWIVEKYNSFARIRQDLYGFIDIVAIRKDLPGVLGIQTTSGSNVSAHLLKIKENPHFLTWRAAGNLVHVHGWRKVGERGKRKLWDVRIEDVSGIDVPSEPLSSS